MRTPIRPPFLRRRLGAKLRRMREQAGLTLDEAAAKLDKARSALNRIETGETKADVHLARSIMDIYDIFDANLLDEVREAAKTPWFRAYGFKDLGYVDVETAAARVSEFSTSVIPGLLQTEAYIRALFRLRPNQDPIRLKNDTRVRIIRQARLTDQNWPLELSAVVDEGALRREVGGVAVMREQLRHLIAVAELPTVTLQVLPLKRGVHHSMDGAFAILRFPDPEDPELLYVEYPGGALHIEEPEKVEEAKLSFDCLRSDDALSPADSVALLDRMASELHGP
ncbi:helix-turn-helix transcriptional regulator [Kibdelosporangium persicum]|uniref:Transcriptional regulator n=1 Tax=Kibdelosporangium persicum TaxID=2698649 RepID=A0ABX2EVQ1_9PSEU|nr:helix-turn-helix transcriptional regulator [Kibdelosporangium persicum]NRN63096.1 Transcriptional regulator [Kibdelosporangium persicum]